MQRESVSSSNIASVGYNPTEKILEIEFNHGGIYQYFDVPQEVYDDLISASSHGKYFRANIMNCYECGKIN